MLAPDGVVLASHCSFSVTQCPFDGSQSALAVHDAPPMLQVGELTVYVAPSYLHRFVTWYSSSVELSTVSETSMHVPPPWSSATAPTLSFSSTLQ